MTETEKFILAAAIVLLILALVFAAALIAEELKKLKRTDRIINEKLNRTMARVSNTDWLPVPLQEYLENEATENEITKEIWEALFNGEESKDQS